MGRACFFGSIIIVFTGYFGVAEYIYFTDVDGCIVCDD